MVNRRKGRLNSESPAAYQNTREEIRQRVFQRAVKLLAAKPRSIAELREKLLQGRSSKNAVESVIDRLKEYGYLNDENFALSYVSLKVKQRPMGRQRLKRDLALKKVDRVVADEALDQVFAEVSEEALIEQALEKRINNRGFPKTRAEAKSLFEHLLRCGFPLELVAEKVRAATSVSLDEVD